MLHIYKDLFQWDALQSRPQKIDAMAWISLDTPSAYKFGHRQSRACHSERVAGEQLQRCTCILSVDTPPGTRFGGGGVDESGESSSTEEEGFRKDGRTR